LELEKVLKEGELCENENNLVRLESPYGQAVASYELGIGFSDDRASLAKERIAQVLVNRNDSKERNLYTCKQ
jgi:hypothetical protein